MITILTNKKNSNLYVLLKNILKYTYLFFIQKLYLDIYRFYDFLKYSGHVDVTKSLILGLKENQIKFNINPKKNDDYYDNVIVLSGLDELKIAIKLKEHNVIKNLLVGPNICVLPSDIDYLFKNKAIDKIITPSKWVTESYIKEIAEIRNKFFEWPAGVDTTYWKPKLNSKEKYVLIYIKRPFSAKKIYEYIKILNNRKISFKIINYGFYNSKQYLKLLQNSKYSIFFSISESQGIAMLESWSVGVPSLIYENYEINYKKTKIICDTSPYLSNYTGMKFGNLNDFTIKLNLLQNNYNKYDTRKWVLENLTNKISSKILTNIID